MRALARSSKPTLSNSTPTSDAAARTVEPRTPNLRARVYAAIKMCADGATADELEGLTGLRGDTIRPRIVELRERSLIEERGTRPTRRGNEAAVWHKR